MIDYVARALAQQALAASGGGVSLNTYSKEEIDVKLAEMDKKITENNEDLKTEITEEVTTAALEEIKDTVVTEETTFVIDGGTIK